MKIAFLDTKTLGYQLDYTKFKDFGEVDIYDYIDDEDVIKKCWDHQVLISNKVKYTREMLQDLPNLKLICLTATGTDTVDLLAAKELGIDVKNVVSYSTDSVVQLTFSMIFKMLTPIDYYNEYVKKGAYINDYSFSHYNVSWHELSQMTLGIVGLGNIGKKVADIAAAFGAKIIYYSTSGNHKDKDYEQVDFESLLQQSDIISIHAPLTKASRNLFTLDAFKKMKTTAYLLNLGRGPIVNEEELIEALNTNEIAGAALDVLETEPMKENHPSIHLKDPHKLLITPHVGWASIEARNRMLDETYKNIQAFIDGSDYQSVV